MATTYASHPAPDYSLVVDGRDITARIDPRIISLRLTEARGDEADELELELSDSDGALAIPPKGATIELALGWAGRPLVYKGTFTVDEVEHTGAPDKLAIKARSADLRREMRVRAEKSWHNTTIGAIVSEIAGRHQLTPRVDAQLAGIKVQHIDQTHESDLHFLSRLARQHDAVATVKAKRLLFLPINGTQGSSGQGMPSVTITRADGDQHRYHSADRNAYTGVRAQWHDAGKAEKRGVLAGTSEREKKLKDTYATEADALAAAKAELQRVERGKATLELTLALGRPELAPQTEVQAIGFKPQIDGTPWVVVKLTHSLGDGGLTTRIELETRAA